MKIKNNWMNSRALMVILLSLLASACATTKHQADMTTQTGELFLAPGRINVSLNAQSDENTHSQAVKAEVEKDLRLELVQKGYRMDDSRVMLEVKVDVNVEPLDVTGNYVTLNGEARLEVVGAYDPDRPVLGAETVSVEGSRTLGEAKAYSAMSREMSKSLSKALGAALANGAKQVRSVTVTVTLGWLSFEDARAYPGIFVKEVSKLDGVIDCVLLENDVEQRTSTYQVVQEAEAFPQGFETVLAEIKALKIR
jgi:hypothetical protein